MVFNVMRELLSGNKKLTNMIDIDYEEEVLFETTFIPRELDELIINSINAVKIVVKNMNFISIHNGLCKVLGNAFINLRNEYNIFSLFLTVIDNLKIEDIDKQRVKNIVSKYKPLMTCIDYLINNPYQLSQRASTLQRSLSDDVNIL